VNLLHCGNKIAWLLGRTETVSSSAHTQLVVGDMLLKQKWVGQASPGPSYKPNGRSTKALPVPEGLQWAVMSSKLKSL